MTKDLEPEREWAHLIHMRLRVIFVSIVLLLGSLSGCARPTSMASSADSTVTGSSGVQGMATVDVGCPVLEGSSPCARKPLRARIKVLRLPAQELVAVIDTAEDGRFLVELAPGSYELRGEDVNGVGVPSAMPLPVNVTVGAVSEVTVQFDSGVR